MTTRCNQPYTQGPVLVLAREPTPNSGELEGDPGLGPPDSLHQLLGGVRKNAVKLGVGDPGPQGDSPSRVHSDQLGGIVGIGIDDEVRPGFKGETNRVSVAKGVSSTGEEFERYRICLRQRRIFRIEQPRMREHVNKARFESGVVGSGSYVLGDCLPVNDHDLRAGPTGRPCHGDDSLRGDVSQLDPHDWLEGGVIPRLCLTVKAIKHRFRVLEGKVIGEGQSPMLQPLGFIPHHGRGGGAVREIGMGVEVHAAGCGFRFARPAIHTPAKAEGGLGSFHPTRTRGCPSIKWVHLCDFRPPWISDYMVLPLSVCGLRIHLSAPSAHDDDRSHPLPID